MVKFDRKTFFNGFRAQIDESIEQEQVDGLEFLLGKIEKDKAWKSIPEIAYALATAGHETAWSFQPVTEGYYLAKTDPPDYAGKTAKVKRFQKTLRYYPYHGRGYVQLTWKKNYEKAAKVLGLDLVNKPELALDREGAYLTMTAGMHEGWFTGKKLSDYISDTGKDYKNARKIINGLDKAGLIAGYANQFESILRASKTNSAAVPSSAPSAERPQSSALPSSEPQPPTQTLHAEITPEGGVSASSSAGPTQNVVIEKKEGWLKRKWKELTAYVAGLGGLDGLTDYTSKVQTLGLSADFWKRLVWIAGAGVVIYLIFDWYRDYQERKLTGKLVEANSTPTNMVAVATSSQLDAYEQDPKWEVVKRA